MVQSGRVLYTVRAHSTGGRDGISRSDDGRLDLKLSTPGTSGIGTSPEQLLAAAWSASFLGALKTEAGKRRISLLPGPSVDAEIDLAFAAGVYTLTVRLTVALPGADPATGQLLATAARRACPFCRAMRGSITVLVTVV
jgi:osmotically inducible protein OsmC